MAIEAKIVILENKLLNLRNRKISCCMLQESIEEAVKKLKRIYAFLIKEECQQSKELHHNWKERLLIAMDKIEDGIETYLYKVALQQQDRIKVVRESWVILKNKYSLYQAMQQFVKTTNGLSEDQHLVDSAVDLLCKTNLQPHQSDWFGISCSDIDMSELTGTTQEQGKSKLVEDLTKSQSENEFKVFAIWGPAGVGKTAITRAVFNSEGIKGRFECHVWVQMWSKIDYKNLLLRILKKVTYWVPMNPERMDTEKLAELVSKQLVRKSILIVLEDAAHENLNILFEFLIRLPDSPTGSCIIITTDNEGIANILFNPIKLEPLEETCQRKLLMKTIGNGSPQPDNNEISNMLESCGGSPLKISLLGKLLLSCSNKEDWPSFSNKQGSSSSSDMDHVYGMCYNKLPPHIKPCFLYLCLFPKSSPILIRRILRLWISEDLIRIEHPNKNKDHPINIELEDIGESYLQEMVKRNLVDVVRWKSDGTPHAFHMNANLYDAFLPFAHTIGLLDVHKMDELKNQQPFNYVRWLVEPEYAQLGKRPDLSSLSGRPRSFMSFHTQKGILSNGLGRLFKTEISKLGLLRVLDLEGVYKPYLGKSLQKLLLLRYLGLRSTALDSLPTGIGNLPYLETLDLKHTNVIGLPTSLWKMAHIRHLDLNGFHFDEAQLRDFSRATFISTLRTLSGFHVACRIDEHILSIDFQGLTKLSKLGINFHNPRKDEMDEIAKWIKTLTGLKSLKLGITGRSSSKDNNGQGMLLQSLVSHNNLFRVYLLGELQSLEANIFPPCLRVLTLSASNLVSDPMKSLGAKDTLPNLRELRLLADSYNGTEMICPDDSFPNLLVLKLWKLASLERISFRKRSMLKLEHLEIRYCSELKICEVAQNLKPQLKELIVFSDHPGKITEIKKNLKEKEKFPQLYVRGNNRGSLDEVTEDEPPHTLNSPLTEDEPPHKLNSPLTSANEDNE